ncbi:MAG: thioredoxin family protein, partial [Dechloromonas sp.]|nr:thioredoxin family protein [Dechloromonas sp.]
AIGGAPGHGAPRALAAGWVAYPDLAHIKIEDGPGRRLGRTYRVKLWPTLIFLRDGQEVERLVRPTAEADVAAALRRLSTG